MLLSTQINFVLRRYHFKSERKRRDLFYARIVKDCHFKMAPVTDTVDRINEPLRRSFTILEPVKTTSNDNTIRDVMEPFNHTVYC